MSDWARDTMHQHPGCAMYDEIGGMLTSMTMQLRSAIQADADMPTEYAATIFNIYNEALSNVAQHAGASRVVIGLTITPHEVTLVVADNGIGIETEATAPGTGGLAGMRARLQTHEGVCEVTGARDTGTTVTATLPIARAP